MSNVYFYHVQMKVSINAMRHSQFWKVKLSKKHFGGDLFTDLKEININQHMAQMVESTNDLQFAVHCTPVCCCQRNEWDWLMCWLNYTSLESSKRNWIKWQEVVFPVFPLENSGKRM